jgi:hypothetical protein
MTVTITRDFGHGLREYFVSPPSSDALEMAGPFVMELQKGPHTGFEGEMYVDGNGDMQLSLKTQGSMNVGADKANAFSNSKASGGARAVPKSCRFWSYFVMDGDELKLVKGQTDVANPTKLGKLMNRLDDTQENWWRTVGVYTLRSGRGGCARLSAASGVGTTLTFANPDMVRAFEVDDVIHAYDPAAYTSQPGVLATPRVGGTRVVQGRDEDAGTITIDAAWSGIGGAAGDIVGHQAYRQPAGGALTASLYGAATWLAYNTTDRTATALGVNRALDPGRTSGRLIQLPAGTPASQVVKKMLTAAGRFNIKINRIYAPSTAYDDVQANFLNQTRTGYDAETMRFGVEGCEFVGPGIRGPVLAEPYLWDESSGAQIYLGVIQDNWGYVTTEEGVGWDGLGRPENDGVPIIDTNGQGLLSASYGAVGQLVCRNPGKSIIVRVG